MNRLLALVRVRLLEVARDRTALVWNFVLAPLLVIGVAILMSRGQQPMFEVGVLGSQALTQQTHAFFATEAVNFHGESDEAQAVLKLQRHRIDLLFDPRTQPARYWVNPQSNKSLVLERLLRASDATAVAQRAEGEPLRYADWLVPGLLGVNIMFTCLFAIGHVVVRYRKSGYLKRLRGTPITAVEFVSAQLIACLILTVGLSSLIYAICKPVLHLRMEGHYLDLLIVTAFGAMSMISMGLLVSARLASEEISGGIMTLMSWPMVLLSGVFFSLDGAPGWVRSASELLPLTHLLGAARAIMIDGAGLADVSGSLIAMAGMTALFVLIGAASFRWTQD